MSIETQMISTAAAHFIADLVREFSPRLQDLLSNRVKRQQKIDLGELPSFDPATREIRETEWKVAKIPNDIIDRRVEITGPPDRKMVINALNSGANVFMADFEDSLSPTWTNVLDGQKNLYDAVRGTITYRHPTKGRYSLNKNPAVLFVRPRGLHLTEAHFHVDGARCPASLFDFGLYMFLNAKWLSEHGRAPYFYLPKLEHGSEAEWWNDVFVWAQERLEIPVGTIRATVLLETLPAAFQMNEILWALREHSAGLNCGRWDYIFSYIKTFRNHSDRITPDRSLIGMTSHFMKSYSELVIQTCHRRGVHAMGGMAAQIPIRGDDEANSHALRKVREDKTREVKNGHDGTWVAHPGLVSLAQDVFNEYMTEPNQINKHTDYTVCSDDLLAPPSGTITHEGLKQNIDVGVRYLASWLQGQGCVPLYNLMEDAATAEISRTQVWQWLKYHATIEDGSPITLDLVRSLVVTLSEEDESLHRACGLFLSLCEDTMPIEFLTLPAYERIKNAQQ